MTAQPLDSLKTPLTKWFGGLGISHDDGMTNIEYQHQIVQLEARLLRVAAQAESLRQENVNLRRRVRRVRPSYSTIVHRAHRDVQLMYGLFLAGTGTSRANCIDVLGLTVRRWNWARALAQLSGVHDGWEFYEELAMPEFLRRLSEGADLAEAEADLLRSYLPK